MPEEYEGMGGDGYQEIIIVAVWWLVRWGLRGAESVFRGNGGVGSYSVVTSPPRSD